MFEKNYIIVDNFYQQPDDVRHMAVEDSLLLGNGNYPGVMTANKLITDSHLEIFSHLTNESVTDAGGLSGHFRFTEKTDVAIQHIHFDTKPNLLWAGVVHLSRQQDIDLNEKSQRRCGTVFWRHDRTGLESMLLTENQQRQFGLSNVDEIKQFLETEGVNEDLWTETFYVPPRFNRLVLFRPWLFHSVGKAFGNSRENCRLVQLIFLKLADTQN